MATGEVGLMAGLPSRRSAAVVPGQVWKPRWWASWRIPARFAGEAVVRSVDYGTLTERPVAAHLENDRGGRIEVTLNKAGDRIPGYRLVRDAS